MYTHTTPPPHADQTDQTAEPARRAPRFDERGIALQTVIIMVVMLAIAGAIAGVLFNRAQESQDELEATPVTVNLYRIKDADQCRRAGGNWETATATGDDLAQLQVAFGGSANVTAADDYCKP